MNHRLARVVGAAAVAAAAALTTAAPAFAHATLQETEPARGTTVKVQPKAIVFHFSERVEMNFSAVHVYDATGKVVDSGEAVHPNGVGSDVSIGLKPKVPQGTYTATYRVISADGHPVSGGFVFSIGKAGAAPALTVAELAGGSDVGSGTTIAFGIARAVQYGAIALAIGALAFILLPWVGGLRAVAGAGPEWQAASEAFLARSRLAVPRRRGRRRRERNRRDRAAGANGGRRLRARRDGLLRRAGRARDALRLHLGPPRPRLARARRDVAARLLARGASRDAPGDALGRRARALARLRQPSAARRPARPARLPRHLAGAGGPRERPGPDRDPAALERGPRDRDQRLDRRPRDAPVRAPTGDAVARAARPRPAARGRALPLLDDRRRLRGGRPADRDRPVARLRPQSRQPAAHGVRPDPAREDRALRRVDGARRLQPAVQRPAPEQDRGRR